MNLSFTKNIKDHVPASSGGSSGGYLNYLKEQVTQLRLLQDYDELLVAKLHYDKNARMSFPCPGEGHKDICPGCEGGFDTSNKIIVQAINTDSGYANVYALPISLDEPLSRLQDRDGSLKKRDVIIYKTKKNDRVSYTMDRDDEKTSIPEYNEDFLPDREDVLMEAWKNATNKDVRDARVNENQNKEPESRPSVVKEQNEPEPPPFDEVAVEASTPRGGMTEAEVRAMKFVPLMRLATELGLESKINEDMSKQEIADVICEAFAEED